MIDVSNLKDTLKTLGFIAYGDIYEKAFSEIGCSLKVDFQAKRLIYPNEIKGRERNDSFDQKENFVVFECVCRLLSKGYRPEHIELEKEWHLGHDAKGGRADICVSDTSGNMLFIIECKTWGREYDKALNNTKSDGAQLFSYWQQEHSCKWLVLYASDLRSGCIAYKAPTIDCSDDANIILLSKKDKSIKLYRDAHTTSAKYEAWKETYGSQIHDDLIFSEDSVAYQIGVKPLRKKDLRDFTPDDKIVNKFEEILRHNNVSDKENAFNRLVALFICKLVDESTKNEDAEVEFQYKQGTDTYETLQDRLQRLHRDGMEKFMREEILYVSADYPEWLFSTYTGSKRKRAIEDLQNTIRILKFCNLVHYIFAPGEKHFSRRLAARVSQIIDNNLFQMNRQITQHYYGYVSNNQQKKLITWANKQSRTNFSFDLFEMLVQCDARMSKATKTQLKIFLRQRIAAAQENNNNGIVVYPNKHPYEELDQVGYWCLINVLNAKDFREFLGNSAAFDFYCEYTKFDFNKFDVPWLLNLYPHTLEQIAKNEKVKGCVRVAIANALNDGEIALSDSQRLQSILIKHFC